MESMNGKGASVNRVYDKGPKKQHQKHQKRASASKDDKECYRCGRKGHFGRDPECSAKGKTCSNCGKPDHFAEKCKTKQPSRASGGDRRKVNYVDATESDDEYAFSVNSSHAQTVDVDNGSA